LEQFFDVNFQAEHLQSTDVVVALLLEMIAIKVITTEFGKERTTTWK
jgi:hypothetical protein